ncbi:Class I SAM-dependent methyltransferase [Rhodovastum atsumiense]|uniref:Class I SAM-dependent methyltransferase n=1 Tax=Rhodovastum atsumiense TaxID=504468 RepID=A0A5M6IWJ7_9PROT|nr:class I SAM-dependent methyltransferase [Rhodovastum atsumiense]KAA5612601.1 class I SAM-dependent methyltransferase [Rhodovastum atsumiense]CAH2601300.1 Class I SAM-dependent methyltransferase [Rhodovastum atsumiense]
MTTGSDTAGASPGFRPLTARRIYAFLSTNAFTARGLYLNLGYWPRAGGIDEACEALVELIGETAGMGPGDEVVDVGFGFADQDMFWLRRFAPRRIIGFNVTPAQVRIARARLRRMGLAGRIDLREGSATQLPLPDASCDVVTAVECAFHFDTRERFFAEAFRVLRPGGRLVLADVIPAAPPPGPLRRRGRDFLWNAAAISFAIPAANAYPRDIYRDKLAAPGFGNVQVTSIRDQVFPGWHRAVMEDAALRRRLRLSGWLADFLLRHLDEDAIYRAFDYVLASARKPA